MDKKVEAKAKKVYNELLTKETPGTPEQERIIAQSSLYSYSYATHIIKGPFPLGEKAIAKESYLSYSYAKSVLKAPFPLGEGMISTDALATIHYATQVLKAPFPPGEEVIFYREKDQSRFAHWEPHEREHLITRYIMLCIANPEHLKRLLQYPNVLPVLHALATGQIAPF